MNKKADAYILEVLRNIQAPAAQKRRIETDLRAHFEEAEAAGEAAEAVIGRMGTPTELAVEMMSEIKLNYAGFWRRFAAFLLDSLIIGAVAGLYFLFLITIGAVTLTEPINGSTDPCANWSNKTGWTLIWVILGGLAAVGAALLYFPISEARFGKTWGKKVLGLRIVKENGLSVGYKEAILRRLSFFFNIFWLDALFVFFTEKRQRAFDIIAKTVVIRERK